MEQIDTQLYLQQDISDEVGEGTRIVTSNDDIYEIRQHGETESRIYEHDNDWYGVVRFPTTSTDEAYNALHTIDEAIESQYNLNIVPEFDYLDKNLDSQEEITFKDTKEDIKLRYASDNPINLPRSPIDDILGHSAFVGKMTGYMAGIGAAGGTGLGITLGTVGMLLDPTAGITTLALGTLKTAGLMSGLGGTAGFLPSLVGTPVNKEDSMKEKVNNWRTDRYIDKKVFKEAESVIDKINERNRSQALVKNRICPEEEIEKRYDALEENSLDSQLEFSMDVLFHKFERLAGVTARKVADSYDEAAEFVAVAIGQERTVPTEPSLYTDREVFENCIRQLSYHQDGKRQLLPDGTTLLRNVLQTETSPSVERYIRENLDETLQDVGETEVFGV